MARKLTSKQRLWVEAYLETWNGTEATRRAGYKGNDQTLASVGSENLRKPAIRAAIEARMAALEVSRDRIPDAVTRRLSADDGGFVYLIREEFMGLVKIGVSTDPSARLQDLQVSCPQRLDLVAVIQSDHPKQTEAKLHVEFESKHYRGEWFRLSEEDIAAFQANSKGIPKHADEAQIELWPAN